MAERGKRLGEWVDATFPTRKQGAEACGLTPQGLNDYLTERNRPGADVLARMAAAGLDVGWYLTGKRTGERVPETGIVAEPRPYRPPTEEELARAGAERIDPEPWKAVEWYSTPADMASLFLQRIIAVQDRQRDELREELERVVAEIERR
jgi:transcriptional regulator with XRE-family HTH domain